MAKNNKQTVISSGWNSELLQILRDSQNGTSPLWSAPMDTLSKDIASLEEVVKSDTDTEARLRVEIDGWNNYLTRLGRNTQFAQGQLEQMGEAFSSVEKRINSSKVEDSVKAELQKSAGVLHDRIEGLKKIETRISTVSSKTSKAKEFDKNFNGATYQINTLKQQQQAIQKAITRVQNKAHNLHSIEHNNGQALNSVSFNTEKELGKIDAMFLKLSKQNYLPNGNNFFPNVEQITSEIIAQQNKLINRKRQDISSSVVRHSNNTVKSTKQIQATRDAFLRKIKAYDTNKHEVTLQQNQLVSYIEELAKNGAFYGWDTETTKAVEDITKVLPVTLAFGKYGGDIEEQILSYGGDNSKLIKHLIDAMNIEKGTSFAKSSQELRARFGLQNETGKISDTEAIKRQIEGKLGDNLLKPEKFLENLGAAVKEIRTNKNGGNIFGYNSVGFDERVIENWFREYYDGNVDKFNTALSQFRQLMTEGQHYDVFASHYKEKTIGQTGRLQDLNTIVSGRESKASHTARSDVQDTILAGILSKYTNFAQVYTDEQKEIIAATMGISKDNINLGEITSEARQKVLNWVDALQGVFTNKEVPSEMAQAIRSQNQAQTQVQNFVDLLGKKNNELARSFTGQSLIDQYEKIGVDLRTKGRASVGGVGTPQEALTTLLTTVQQKGFKADLGLWDNLNGFTLRLQSAHNYNPEAEIDWNDLTNAIQIPFYLGQNGRVNRMVNTSDFRTRWRKSSGGKTTGYNILGDRASLQLEKILSVFSSDKTYDMLAKEEDWTGISEWLGKVSREALMGSIPTIESNADREERIKSNKDYSGQPKTVAEIREQYKTLYEGVIEQALTSSAFKKIANSYRLKTAAKQGKKNAWEYNPDKPSAAETTSLNRAFRLIASYGTEGAKLYAQDDSLVQRILEDETMGFFRKAAKDFGEIGRISGEDVQGSSYSKMKATFLNMGDLFAYESLGDLTQKATLQGRRHRPLNETAAQARSERVKNGEAFTEHFTTQIGEALGVDYNSPENVLYNTLALTEDVWQKAVLAAYKNRIKSKNPKIKTAALEQQARDAASSLMDGIILGKTVMDEASSDAIKKTQSVALENINEMFLQRYGLNVDTLRKMKVGDEAPLKSTDGRGFVRKFADGIDVLANQLLVGLERTKDGVRLITNNKVAPFQGLKFSTGHGQRLTQQNSAKDVGLLDDIITVLESPEFAADLQSLGISQEALKKVEAIVPRPKEFKERDFLPDVLGKLNTFMSATKELNKGLTSPQLRDFLVGKGRDFSNNPYFKNISDFLKITTKEEPTRTDDKIETLLKVTEQRRVGYNNIRITDEQYEAFLGYFDEYAENLLGTDNWNKYKGIRQTTLGQQDVAIYPKSTGSTVKQDTLKYDFRYRTVQAKNFEDAKEVALLEMQRLGKTEKEVEQFKKGAEILAQRDKAVFEDISKYDEMARQDYQQYVAAYKSFDSYLGNEGDIQLVTSSWLGGAQARENQLVIDSDEITKTFRGISKNGVVSPEDYQKGIFALARAKQQTLVKDGKQQYANGNIVLGRTGQHSLVMPNISPATDEEGEVYVSQMENYYGELLKAIIENERDQTGQEKQFEAEKAIQRLLSDIVTNQQSEVRKNANKTRAKYSGFRLAKGDAFLTETELANQIKNFNEGTIDSRFNTLSMSSGSFRALRSSDDDAKFEDIYENILTQLTDLELRSGSQKGFSNIIQDYKNRVDKLQGTKNVKEAKKLEQAIIGSMIDSINEGNNKYTGTLGRFPFNQGNEGMLSRIRIDDTLNDEVFKVSQGLSYAIHGDFDGDYFAFFSDILGIPDIRKLSKKDQKAAYEAQATILDYWDKYANLMEILAAQDNGKVGKTGKPLKEQYKQMASSLISNFGLNYEIGQMGGSLFEKVGSFSNANTKYKQGISKIGYLDKQTGENADSETYIGRQFAYDLGSAFMYQLEQDAISTKKLYARAVENASKAGKDTNNKEVVSQLFNQVDNLLEFAITGDFASAIGTAKELGVLGDIFEGEAVKKAIGKYGIAGGKRAEFLANLQKANLGNFGINANGQFDSSLIRGVNVTEELLRNVFGAGYEYKNGLKTVQIQGMGDFLGKQRGISWTDVMKWSDRFMKNPRINGTTFEGMQNIKPFYESVSLVDNTGKLLGTANSLLENFNLGVSSSDQNNVNNGQIVINGLAQIQAGNVQLNGQQGSTQGATTSTLTGGTPYSAEDEYWAKVINENRKKAKETYSPKAKGTVGGSGLVGSDGKLASPKFRWVKSFNEDEHTYVLDKRDGTEQTGVKGITSLISLLNPVDPKTQAIMEKAAPLGTYAHSVIETMINTVGADTVQELEKGERGVLEKLFTTHAANAAKLGDEAWGKYEDYTARANQIFTTYTGAGFLNTGNVNIAEDRVGAEIGKQYLAGSVDLLSFQKTKEGKYQAVVADNKASSMGGPRDDKTFGERIVQASNYFHLEDLKYQTALAEIIAAINPEKTNETQVVQNMLEKLGWNKSARNAEVAKNIKTVEDFQQFANAFKDGLIAINKSTARKKGTDFEGKTVGILSKMTPAIMDEVVSWLDKMFSGVSPQKGGFAAIGKEFNERFGENFEYYIQEQDDQGNLVNRKLDKTDTRTNQIAADWLENTAQLKAAKRAVSTYLKDAQEIGRLDRDIATQRAKMIGASGDSLKSRQDVVNVLQDRRNTIASNQAKITKNEQGTWMLGNTEISDEQYNQIQKERAAILAKNNIHYAKTNANLIQTKSLMGSLTGFIKQMGSYAIGSFMYRMSGLITQSIQTVISYIGALDSAMVNLQVATGDTREEIRTMMQDFNALGVQLGRTTQEVAAAANDWLRAGYSGKQVAELTKSSMELSTLGMIDSSQATSYLISVLKGWKLNAEEVEQVVDKLTAVDMAAAVSAGDLAERMSRANNSAQLARSTMDNFIGYVTTITDVTQKSAASVGESIKTIYSRFGNVKAGKFIASQDEINSEGYNEDAFTALNDIEKVLGAGGVNIPLRTKSDAFRKVDDVLSEIAQKWDNFSNVTQNAIATAVAGTRQRENFVTMMENWELVDRYAGIAANSLGTAAKKMDAYTDSIAANRKRITAAVEGIVEDWNGSSVMGELFGTFAQLIEHLKEFSIALAATLLIFKGNKIAPLLGGFVADVGGGMLNVGNKIGSGVSNFMQNPFYAVSSIKQGFQQGAMLAAENRYLAVLEGQISSMSKRGLLMTNEQQSLSRLIVAEAVDADALERQALIKVLSTDLTSQGNALQSLANITDADKIAAEATRLGLITNRNILDSNMITLTEEQEQAINSQVLTILGIKESGQKLTEAQTEAANIIRGNLRLQAFYGVDKNANNNNGAPAVYAIKGMGNGKSTMSGATAANVGSLAATIAGYSAGSYYEKKLLGEDSSGMIGGLGMSLIGSTAVSTVASGISSAGSLGAAIKGGALAGPLGIAIGALVAIVAGAIQSGLQGNKEKLIKKRQEEFKKLSERENKLNEQLGNAVKFDELSKGVDSLGRNITLTDDEYQEFLDLSNQLGSAMPELIDHFDSAGNSVLDLGDSAEGVSKYLDKVIKDNQFTQALALIGENGKKTSKEEFNSRFDEFANGYKDLEEQKRTNAPKEMPISLTPEEWTHFYTYLESVGATAETMEIVSKNYWNDYSPLDYNALTQERKDFFDLFFGWTEEQKAAHITEEQEVETIGYQNAILSLAQLKNEFQSEYQSAIMSALGQENYDNLSDEEKILFQKIAYQIDPVSMEENGKIIAKDATEWTAEVKQIVRELQNELTNYSDDDKNNILTYLFGDKDSLTKQDYDDYSGLIIDFLNSITKGKEDSYKLNLAETLGLTWNTGDGFGEINPYDAIINEFSNRIEGASRSNLQLKNKIDALSIEEAKMLYDILANSPNDVYNFDKLLTRVYKQKYDKSSLATLSKEYKRLEKMQQEGVELTQAQKDNMNYIVNIIKTWAKMLGFGDDELDVILNKMQYIQGVNGAGDITETPQEIAERSKTYEQYYQYMRDDYSNGTIDSEMINGLLSDSGTAQMTLQFFNGELSKEQYLKQLKELYEGQEELQKNALAQELLNNEDIYAEMISQNSDLVDQFKKNYGIDLTAFTNYNTLKSAIDLLFNNNAFENGADWVKKMAEFYQEDLANFTNFRTTKTVLEKALGGMGFTSEEADTIIEDSQRGYRPNYDIESLSEYSTNNVYNDPRVQARQNTNFQGIAETLAPVFEAIASVLPNITQTGKDASKKAEEFWEAYESALVKEFAEHRVAVKLGGLDVSYEDYSAAMYEEYYKEMYDVLDNQIRIYRSKANMTTEEGLQYTQKLREAEMKEKNLDDEIAETNLEIAKLKGATVEEQIHLTEAIRDTSDGELEYLQRVQEVNEAQKQRVELLKAQKELINKEYYEIYQSVLGINNASATYFENITRNIEKQIEELENYLNTAQNLGEIDKLNVQAEIQNLYVELANVDDQLVEDALSFLQNIGASQNALVAQYQEKIATADTEQERIQYEHELNEAILERMKLEKEFFEFEKKVMDYEMEYFEGLPESDNYKKQLDKMIQNTKDTLAKTKEILQQSYNNIYEDTIHGYQNVIDANGNRVYSDSDIQKMIDDGTIDAEVQQNKEYQDAMIDYIEAQQALGDLMMEDFTNQIDAIERRIKELETSKPVEWGTEWDEENKKIIRKATDRIKTYYNKLEEYYKQEAASAFKTLEEQASILTDAQIEELVAKYNDAMKQIRDNEVQLREDIKDYQESVYSALVNEVGRYKDQLEKQKELVSKYYDEELEKLQDKEQSIARTNNLIELQNRLLSTQQEKERVYREGKKSALYKENYIG